MTGEATPVSIRYLWVLRHGQATDGGSSGGGDRARTLTQRGRSDATTLGRRLHAGTGAFGLVGVPVPETIVCSAATRTVQTAESVRQAMGGGPAIDAYRSLYGAGTATVLGVLREVDDGIRSLLLVGHSPTVHQLVWELVSPPAGADPIEDVDGDDRSVVRSFGFPTCGMAVVALDVRSWAECAGGGPPPGRGGGGPPPGGC
jgi:phosphohistidine phosphatase